MSYIIGETLDSEVEQTFTLTLDRRYPVKSIALWLYLSDVSVGSVLTVKVKDSDDNVLVSQALPIAGIKTQLGASATYSHGKYQWTPPSNLILSSGVYKITLQQTTGYAVGNYIAWCKDWESEYIPVSGTVTYDSDTPYYFRLYTYKERI